jgi:serine protease Do
MTSFKIGPEDVLWLHSSGGFGFFIEQKPPKIPLKEFLERPRLILDRALQAALLNRVMAGEKIRITSLGEPARKWRWTDDLGRPWLSASWNLAGSESRFTLHCLPIPAGAACIDAQNPLAAEAHGAELTQKKQLNEVLFGYIGTLGAWSEFLALEPSLLPTVFHGGEIKKTGESALKLNLGRFHLLFEDPAVKENPQLKLHMGYSPLQPPALEILNFELSTKEAGRPYFLASSRWLPPHSAGDEARESWNNLLAGKGDFDGQPHTQGEWARLRLVPALDSAKGKIERVDYAVCGYLANESAVDIAARCRKFQQSLKAE